MNFFIVLSLYIFVLFFIFLTIKLQLNRAGVGTYSMQTLQHHLSNDITENFEIPFSINSNDAWEKEKLSWTTAYTTNYSKEPLNEEPETVYIVFKNPVIINNTDTNELKLNYETETIFDKQTTIKASNVKMTDDMKLNSEAKVIFGEKINPDDNILTIHHVHNIHKANDLLKFTNDKVNDAYHFNKYSVDTTTSSQGGNNPCSQVIWNVLLGKDVTKQQMETACCKPRITRNNVATLIITGNDTNDDIVKLRISSIRNGVIKDLSKTNLFKTGKVWKIYKTRSKGVKCEMAFFPEEQQANDYLTREEVGNVDFSSESEINPWGENDDERGMNKPTFININLPYDNEELNNFKYACLKFIKTEYY